MEKVIGRTNNRLDIVLNGKHYTLNRYGIANTLDIGVKEMQEIAHRHCIAKKFNGDCYTFTYNSSTEAKKRHRRRIGK